MPPTYGQGPDPVPPYANPRSEVFTPLNPASMRAQAAGPADAGAYAYDPYNVQYRPMDLTEWHQVQADQSAYSNMWESPAAFQPATFSQNTRAESSCKDACWALVFALNFVATVILIAVIASNYRGSDAGPSAPRESEIGDATARRVLGGAIGVGIGINVVHYLYATCAPFAYIRWGVIFGLVVSVACAIIPVIAGNPAFILFPVLMVPIWLIYYCILRSRFELSAAVLQVATRLICRYPSTLFLALVQGALEIGITAGILLAIRMASQLGMSPFVYVYLIFSFLWISITLAYVVYLTFAGLAGSWYFLTGTDYEPKSPVWESFKRAATSSLGSAALAAFILAVIQLLKVLARSRHRHDEGCVVAILRCCALCILNCLESCVKWMTRYALIYCGVFGVPFGEGCRRWAELSVKKFAEVIVNGCVIGEAIGLNFLMFVIGGALLGYGIGNLGFDHEPDDHRIAVLFALATAATTLAVFSVLEKQIRALSDTIIVCFVEAPERLQSSALELYRLLADFYGKELTELTAT
jgi:hypothetical protein